MEGLTMMTDNDASEKESQHGGDPLTLQPRLYCTTCDEWIYATQPRHFKENAFYLECECKAIHPDSDLPEVWERAF